MKKEVLIIGILFLAITLPLVSSFFHKDVRESPQDVSVVVGNPPPEFIDIQAPTTVGLNAGGTKAVSINFTVQDNSGFANINDATLSILFFNDTPEQRSGNNLDCVITNDGSNKKYYNCTINMEHYDAAGNWNITLIINDSGATPIEATNDTESFTVSQLKDIDPILPTTISFGTVNHGDLNTPGSESEVTNYGNFNILIAGLTITAQHLNGSVIINEIIPAGNFSSANEGVDPCALGIQLSENVAIPIPDFLLLKGTQATPFPNQNITHCLTEVPPGLSDQEYSTTFGTIPWELLI